MTEGEDDALARFREQLERSSLGTPGARQLRARVPDAVIENVAKHVAYREQQGGVQ